MAKAKQEPVAAAVSEPTQTDAGEFSPWLAATRRIHQLQVIGADVPCGECTACCRSSQFVHVGPDEHATLARIPRRLLFPAPGLPKGHRLMGYNEQGECPMFVAGACSIYEHRPRTCRDYDCRVFAATGIAADEQATHAAIGKQARTWKFSWPRDIDRREFAAVQAAGTFLKEHRTAFPPGSLPPNPAQLAALAVQVYGVFLKLNEAAAAGAPKPPASEIAKSVLSALADLDTARPPARQHP